MWRSNHRASLVGSTDLLCATFLETPHLAFYVVGHIKG
jgi:hypothetical protein